MEKTTSSSEVDELLEFSYLYDFYGNLLKENHRMIFEDYVLNNLSLGEIAAERGITRQGIYDIVKQIPRGTVATYGQVAALAGNKRWARVVGYALHVNPDPEGIPCYRVVNREGRVSEAFAFGGENRQIGLLEADGIEVKDGCVDLSKYQWRKEIF